MPNTSDNNKPQSAVTTTSPNVDVITPGWPDPVSNRHNVRVLCDLAGLPTVADVSIDMNDGTIRMFMPKDIITACVEQESQFYNYLPSGKPVSHQNIVNGIVESTDWGIIQCNDKAHIGVGKDFPSVEYVLANPDVMVDWMIDMYKVGRLSMWDSYSSGAYKKYLPAVQS